MTPPVRLPEAVTWRFVTNPSQPLLCVFQVESEKERKHKRHYKGGS